MTQAQSVRLSNYIQSAGSQSFSAKLIQPADAKFEPAGSGKKVCKISNGEVTLTPSGEKALVKKGRLALPFASAAGEKITFTIIQDQFEKNKVIAHRGAWKEKDLPENSLASLKEASKIGCTGSEFDVHMTADSVIVVNHDPEFKGMKIEESTYSQLLTKKHENGESIPTLEAYLKAGLAQQRTKLILEIKASKISKQRTLALTDKVLKMVSDLQAQAWVEYISFDDDALRHVLQVTPEVRVQSLDGKMSPEQLKSDRFYGADYHFSVYQKQPGFIKEAHDRGIKINAWTVNEEKDMREMLEKGADFITTNFPNLLLRITKN
ncbi:MAG: glycerophosphodiester phosphodiesterase [Mucilaginibacter polytrichastri]|nr:glycerophosphodiester phosphodiesterase [Mucilaginibacter polytrichastri]